MTTSNTSSVIFKDKIVAFRSARQAGEMDHPAFMAAMQAYEGHQPGDSEAGRMVGLMIRVATERLSGSGRGRLTTNLLRHEGLFNDDQE